MSYDICSVVKHPPQEVFVDCSVDALSQQYGRLRLASSRMGLGYDNLKFLAIEEQVARVSVKFFASWTGKSGKTIREDAHTEVELKKIEGDWKFSQINYLKK